MSICPPKTHEYAEAQRAPSVLRRVKAVSFIEDPPKVPRNLTACKLFGTSIINFDRALSKSVRRGRHWDDPASFLVSLSCYGTAVASTGDSSTSVPGSSGRSCTKGTSAPPPFWTVAPLRLLHLRLLLLSWSRRESNPGPPNFLTIVYARVSRSGARALGGDGLPSTFPPPSVSCGAGGRGKRPAYRPVVVHAPAGTSRASCRSGRLTPPS